MPNRSSKPKKVDHKPWFNSDLHSLKCRKERAQKLSIATQKLNDINKFKRLEKQYSKMLIDTKNSYTKQVFVNYKSNSKLAWQCINKLMGRSKKSSSFNSIKYQNESISDPEKLANIFNTHFSSVATSLHHSLPDSIVSPTHCGKFLV